MSSILGASSIAHAQDSLKSVTVGNIKIVGNRITKSRVILREFVKHERDTISIEELNYIASRTQQNIFNTQLFVYDSVYYHLDSARKTVDFTVKVKERWYMIPAVIFEIQDRNFNSWWLTKDPFRINYGVALDWNNVFGIKDHITLIMRRGYSEKYGISYRMPYINKRQKVGMSFSYSYSRNNEVAFITDNNTLKFHRDYGNYMRQEHEGKVGVTVRNSLYELNTVEVLFNQTRIADTIRKLNPNFLGNNLDRINFFSLQYRYSWDKRDNKPYPLRGWAVDITAVKDGFNVFQSEINNFYIVGQVKRHFRMGGRFYMANLIKARYMNADNWPYYYNKALGYSDFMRGYEYFVIDGQNYVLAKNSVKFQLLKTKVVELKFLKRLPQFSTLPISMYINFNGDAGYVNDKFYYKNNPLSNSFQYGYGIGLDIVTFYDVVVRFEYSLNKMKQAGLFIHMSAGI